MYVCILSVQKWFCKEYNIVQICTKEFQALQKLCNLLHSLIKDFLMVCILQKSYLNLLFLKTEIFNLAERVQEQKKY
ncbi:hypothetical protein BpHYR1_001259 [Brachionus plicatilis]|uniref:Uncharacterized protein n=1 Tax=Brachionus plicatilis TaxID=10195 RepID=A0A3M7RC72_BRAPC|nr:hypothetical protein BpHYR1_001259 [Brachionus plicatilis]